ncbi:MAG: hypothetical protein ACE5F1_12730 [Planctomycetota bacterium]
MTTFAQAAGFTLLCLSSLCSCGVIVGPIPRQMPINSYLGDSRDLMAVRRVMVLPFGGDKVPPEYLDSLRRNFISELSAIHRFQIVPLPATSTDSQELLSSERRGRVSAKGLVKLGQRYHVDGILLVRVTSFAPYLPPVLGLQVHLISIHSGITVWAVDSTYDAGMEAVRLDLLDYRRGLAPVDSLHEWEMVELSPRMFGRYVSHRIVSTLRA